MPEPEAHVTTGRIVECPIHHGLPTMPGYGYRRCAHFEERVIFEAQQLLAGPDVTHVVCVDEGKFHASHSIPSSLPDHDGLRDEAWQDGEEWLVTELARKR